MADKMMRIAGRGEDGLAKSLKTDNNGRLEIGLKGMQLEKEQIATNVAVAAGSAVNVVSSITVKDTAFIKLAIVSSVATELGVNIIPIVEGYSQYKYQKTVIGRQEINTTVLTDKIELDTDTFRVSISNFGTVAANFSVFMYKTTAVTNVSDYDLIPRPIKLATAKVIPANSKRTVISGYRISDAVAFILGIISNAGAERISVEVLPIIDGKTLDNTNYGYEPIVINRPLNNLKLMTDKYLLKSPDFSVSVTNHSATDANIDVILFKSKNTEGCSNFMNEKEVYGATIAERPSHHAVKLGTTYIATSTREMWMSTVDGWGVL